MIRPVSSICFRVSLFFLIKCFLTVTLLKPACANLYNLFHPSDPSALRIEPLLSARFSYIAPVNVPRYQKFPLGDGQPIHLRTLFQHALTCVYCLFLIVYFLLQSSTYRRTHICLLVKIPDHRLLRLMLAE